MEENNFFTAYKISETKFLKEACFDYSCDACGNKFNLGDTVVMACGGWQGGPRLVHEHEAVFDAGTASYIERQCHEATQKS